MVAQLAVELDSAGAVLDGCLRVPDAATGPVPGVVLCHGFAGQVANDLANLLATRGMATLTFKFRGYPPSRGYPIGSLNMANEVDDARRAVEWLKQRPEVDASRVALAGSSLGGTVCLLAAPTSSVSACVAVCPIVTGSTFMSAESMAGRGQRPLTESDVQDRAAEHGVFHRYELVNIPEELRHYLPPETPMEFSTTTYRELKDIDVRAALRSSAALPPTLVVHAHDDRVVPFPESDGLMEVLNERGPAIFVPLAAGDHFLISNPTVMNMTLLWLWALFSATDGHR